MNKHIQNNYKGVRDMTLKEKLRVIKKAIKQGGATIQDDKIIKYKKGYMVGMGNINIIDMRVLQGKENQANQVLQIVGNQYIKDYGLWVDKGLIYIDYVECIEDKGKAIATGIKAKQQTIWDNKEKQIITLP